MKILDKIVFIKRFWLGGEKSRAKSIIIFAAKKKRINLIKHLQLEERKSINNLMTNNKYL